MNKTDFDFLGGFPFSLDDLINEQQSIREAFKGAMSGWGITAGEHLIVSGCIWTGSNYSDGWIFLNGELLRVDAGSTPTIAVGQVAVWALDITYDPAGNRNLESTAMVSAYQVRRGKVISAVYNAAVHMLANGSEPTLEKRIYNIIDASPLAVRKPLVTKVVPIGNWNMTVTTSVQVAHGLADIEKIRSMQAVIRTDAGYSSGAFGMVDLQSSDYPVVTGALQGSIAGVDSTEITLTRLTGGRFDTAAYDHAAYNRGWVTIEYEQ